MGVGGSGFIQQSDDVLLPLALPQLGPAGHVKLTLDGILGQTYKVQSSPNLQDWSTVKVLTNVSGPDSFVDVNAARPAQLYYRAIMP